MLIYHYEVLFRQKGAFTKSFKVLSLYIEKHKV